MNLKVYENISFNSPSKKQSNGSELVGAMQNVEYHKFLKQDKNTVKIRKIFHVLEKNLVYIYYDDLPHTNKETPLDRFADLDLDEDV